MNLHALSHISFAFGLVFPTAASGCHQVGTHDQGERMNVAVSTVRALSA